MCEFISWIEVEKDGKVVVLYLTDKDVFSVYGLEKLKGCQDNDFLGDGAIRAYYDISGDVGEDYEI
ncbi:MAG: hypothetical protein COU81_00595 [Candidatus Portnoybacteria bacterium CG10_big_fil_rev_8_21_14_0_10_36_7]|uniref:Uncharacterized protein n=1 Tax=Candidatus Portnoybacteria bacterium CG10_big_fil_rev_8_21_14_0_10_36_7 TaxID=1974812 RepID=A0A2M8KF06_9BACT|nr:MAG: hypothetical protein COU81_00595 [Candidatus Portnoybacteria bacterium CG10_big_fil_rev_8_21_14_0_10_36_7]